MTPQEWAKAVLSQLGAPQTQGNVTALEAWAAAEGGNWHNTARFNPINTTLKLPGSYVMPGGNSAGVQAYTSWQQGITATVDMLNQSNMRPIKDALMRGADCHSLAFAVGQTPWGTKPSSITSACGQPYTPSPFNPQPKAVPGKQSSPDLNPLDWPGIIAGDIAGAVMSPVSRIFWGVAGVVIALLGALLLVVSVFAPKAKQAAPKAAEGAAKGAAAGPEGALAGAAEAAA